MLKKKYYRFNGIKACTNDMVNQDFFLLIILPFSCKKSAILHPQTAENPEASGIVPLNMF